MHGPLETSGPPDARGSRRNWGQAGLALVPEEIPLALLGLHNSSNLQNRCVKHIPQSVEPA
jgi:hypothetical protein